MLREVFIVRNVTGYEIELKDFGLLIPAGETVDIGEYDNAVISDELYSYILIGDIVRVIDGNDIEIDNAYNLSNPYYLKDLPYENILMVAKSGSTFSGITHALDYITDNDSNNRYLINVSPDLYEEDITMKPYVTIKGMSVDTRIEGRISVSIPVMTSTILENIEVRNFNDVAISVKTTGVFVMNNVILKTYYTSSVGFVKSVITIVDGEVIIGGACRFTLYNNISGTITKNVDAIYNVGGEYDVKLISDNVIHKIISYEQNNYISCVYTDNSSTDTEITINNGYCYNYIYNANPSNTVVSVFDNAGSGITMMESIQNYIEAPNTNTNLTVISAYNSKDNSTIKLKNCSFSWDNTQINDNQIYLAAAIETNDIVILDSCNYTTSTDYVPRIYTTDGNNGKVIFKINNERGTMVNSGNTRLDSLYIGAVYSGGTLINKVLDEDDLSSNDINALATQRSIKKYIDHKSSVSGSTSFFFDAYYTGTGSSIGTSWTDLPLNNQRISSGFTHSETINNSEVTVNEDGVYIVISRVTSSITSGSVRSDSTSKILLDTGSGWTDVPGSNAIMYNRTSANGKDTGTVAVNLSLSSGDKLKIQAIVNNGTNTTEYLSNGCSITIYSAKGKDGTDGTDGADGADGAPGIPGSGQSINVLSNYNSVPGNPFGNLNFMGVNVDVSGQTPSVTGGTANIVIDLDSELPALQVRRNTDFVVTTGWTHITFNLTDIMNQPSMLYLDSGHTDRVYFQKSGLYYVLLATKVTNTTTTTRTDIRFLLNGLTEISGSHSYVNVYQNEIHEVISSFTFDADKGDYIIPQTMRNETLSTLLSDTHMLVYKLEGVKGPQGLSGETGATGALGKTGIQGEIGYGLFAYSKTSSGGVIDNSINLSVNKNGTGTYDYTLLTGTTDTSYGIIGQPYFTTTDTNCQVSNVSNTGFTLSFGQGDNGSSPDVLVDTEHSAIVFGPPSILSGSTSGVPLSIQNSGTTIPNSPVDTINFIGDLITATNAGGNKVNVTVTTPPKTIILQDEDINVTNTPHTTLNFKGDPVTVTDAGSGVADITITQPTLPVYGTEYHYVEDLSSTSSTSTTPQNKLTMTTSNLPSGTYRVTVGWLWSHTSASNDARFDITLGGTPQGTRSTMQMEAKDTNSIYPQVRVFRFTLSGVNTIILRYWNEASSTTISDASIELIRVS